jgi:pimeloyl-ACP methyl ester carboxylesterase
MAKPTKNSELKNLHRDRADLLADADRRERSSSCRVAREWSGRKTGKRITESILGGARLIVLSLLLVQCGCLNAQKHALLRATTIASLGGTKNLVEVERVAPTNQSGAWGKWWRSVEPPSQRTALLLRRYDLEASYASSPDKVIRWLHQLTLDRPSLEEVHALAELAEKQARWSQSTGDSDRATRLFATSIIHAYQFLFDSDLNIVRNAYDPQFRSICDIYNRSLEGLLGTILSDQKFGHNYQVVIGGEPHGIQMKVEIEGRWRNQAFQRFELVSDYEIKGFESEHRTYGLGAPLIAVRQNAEDDVRDQANRRFQEYYPPELTIPMTAFLHLHEEDKHEAPGGRVSQTDHPDRKGVRTAVLSLYDPLEKTYAKTDGKTVPLESDITTPLAYGLKDPLVNKGLLATASLLNAEFAPEAYGMFMIEPYDPTKIPVVMVHGFWDGPSTWAHMINDLRANRELHDNYQFWFYSYPTAQPFWVSAQRFRKDLQAIRDEVDALHENPAMDQMVLVGHSMGGLVSLLQTVDSKDRFWRVVSDRSVDSLKGSEQVVKTVRDTFYFRPNDSVKKVIAIATPFQGSDFANSATRWLSKRLITLPSIVTNDYEKLARENKESLKNPAFLTQMTSIDSLAPSNPIFQAIANSDPQDGVQLHTVVGRLGKRGVFGEPSETSAADGDGVVAVASASRSDAASQVFVAAEHSKLHQHPGCILEVRRVLLKQLAEINRVRARPIPPRIRSAALADEAQGP